MKQKPILFDSQRVCGQVKSFASERFDGFCVVGFVAGSGEACIIKVGADQKSEIAVNQLLTAALAIQSSVTPGE